MALAIYANTGVTDIPLNSSGAEFVEFSEGNDQIVFTDGSDVVKDGEVLPSQNELIQAGIQLTGSEIQVALYLLSDLSANELKEIHLMGNLDSRYVLAFDFDAPTASEPVLEFWDDINLNTVTSTVLGAGTPTQSMMKGITTTLASSGTNWTGKSLAGSSSNHFLFLNNENGALNSATTLYCQLKLVIPASQTVGFSANPVGVVKWLSN